MSKPPGVLVDTYRGCDIYWYAAGTWYAYAVYDSPCVSGEVFTNPQDLIAAIDDALGPEPEPEGWLFIENYRGYPIYLWQTQDEYYGYWFAHEGEQWGPYSTLSGARSAIDGILAPEPSWEHHSTYRGIEIQVWMPDGTPYTAYFNDIWNMADSLSTLQAAIDNFLGPVDTSITINGPPTFDTGDPFMVHGILRDAGGTPLGGLNVKLFVDEVFLTQENTQSDGSYAFTIALSEPRNYIITASYGGTSASLMVNLKI